MKAELRALASQRTLLLALTERSIKARYRGSTLGLLWSLVNPLLLLLVYTLVFRYVFQPRIGSAPTPYALFLFTGLLPWTWFAQSLQEASQSIVDGGALLKKVAFPAEVLPLVSVLSNAVHFLLAVPILLGFVALAGPGLTRYALLAPLAAIIQLLYATGFALALASLGVVYRDVRDLLGHALTLGFFTTPILYTLEGIPERLREWLRFNPLTPLFKTYQDTLFFGRAPEWLPLGCSAAGGLLVAWLGYIVFGRYRMVFAEEV